MLGEFAVAVLIPCHNEAMAIGDVVANFRRALPHARIYVYDNNSTDATVAEARRSGAEVRSEPRRGKGHVVRRMFADVDADIYVLADGDGTYAPEAAPEMISRLVADDLDMMVAARRSLPGAERFGHRWGNRLFNAVIIALFGNGFSDAFSGYRVLSRRFVKSFPALSTGFEIETEMTVHALELRMPALELPADYHPRGAGSASKLRTIPDGLRILWAIVQLCREIRPFGFYGLLALVLILLALVLSYPLFVTYLQTGLVPRFPTAILVTGIGVLAFVSLTCGLILDSVARGRREVKRLIYLALPPLGRNANAPEGRH
ncbi:MAG: glycosyltransferase [Gammaproteobacteria bacterium]|nr:glycosyltransferase [Gammaproteobacteria bacterium]